MSGMVVDTSAAMAILSGEGTLGHLVAAFDGGGPRLMSAATLVELGIVLEARYGPVGFGIAERLLREGDITVVATDHEQATAAVGAWRRFGTGRHEAALNLGDCFTYALAEVSDLPILCTGADFGRTDRPVVA